jgi:hypothetical protein
MNLIDTVLNELYATNECRAAIHAAKVAAGGRMTDIVDEWVNLPASFGETAEEIITQVCGARGVNPRDIGFFPEGA